jgi:ADP-dependent NAD(P)H-hydrate dehydratase / NAD(P)H-hydrate epimerase
MKILDQKDIGKLLPKRAPDSHKGDFGHVLVIGGEPGLSGAALMAGQAALRVGAGLVSIATHPHHSKILNLTQPELMVYGIEHVEQLDPLLAKADVIVLGPGMSIGTFDDWWSQQLIDYCLDHENTKKLHDKLSFVIDAGALARVKKLKLKQDNWVLTPHPKEAANLLGANISHIQDKRPEKVRVAQKQYGGVCVLKGHNTLVDDGENTYLCEYGNPGMATGGMGDVLAGMIAGFLSQGLSLIDAARVGVLSHALSADLASEDFGQRSLLPTDLFSYFSKII